MKTYDQMHSGLHWARGRASEHLCVTCGGAAVDWAYLYTARDRQIVEPVAGRLNGRVYSENFDDYSPMCRSCHRRFDMAADPSRCAHLHALNADPAHQPKRVEYARRGREIQAQQRAADPEKYRARDVEIGRKLGAIKRRCDTCGMVTVAGPLGAHQKRTGHEGWSPA